MASKESKMKGPEDMTPEELQQVLQNHNTLTREVANLRRKVVEFDQELQQHVLVLQTLEPMADDRRCFRLVGDVLVERNVGVVRPALESQKKQLQEICEVFSRQILEKEEEIKTIQSKYRIGRPGAPGTSRQQQEAVSAGGAAERGVLA